jgi:diaminohydroxyphosphoribosylaminopyrimidine deaminase/5-amino-6-(5-phosphoribosylamino)uracil reductase
MDSKNEIYHQRCIDLAKNGLGRVAPNPLVGAVIVADNRIIGEGYHADYGGAHAEVVAVNSVKDKNLLKNSTLYVNLEPCSHFGKTPPCADLIIENKIPHVVIGHADPYPKVAGRGIERMKNAGINVEIGLLEKDCRELNKRFLTFHEKLRPYIILKWAESADGFIDFSRNPKVEHTPAAITDETTRTLVHKWRTEEQAILIGTNTALYDNPKLNAREFAGKNPVRMVLDRSLSLPKDLHLFDQSIKTVVFTEKDAVSQKNIEFVKTNFHYIVDQILNYCYCNSIQSIIVEGGSQLLTTFITMEMWDEAGIFKSQQFLVYGVKAPEFNKIPNKQVSLSNSTLYYYQNSYI